MNKLNSNDILIMNRTINEYIQYIEDSYENANDYFFLQNSVNELQKNIMWKNYKRETKK